MSRLIGTVVVVAVIACTAFVGAAVSLLLVDDHEQRLDKLEHPEPVVRGQGGESSRPSPSVAKIHKPSAGVWVRDVNGVCLQTGPGEAAKAGLEPDPTCGKSLDSHAEGDLP